MSPYEINFDADVAVEYKIIYQEKEYTLKEATGEGAVLYNNRRAACVVLSNDGKIARLKNIADLEPLLVSLCLYDSNGKLVPEKVIKTWPSTKVRQLHDLAKKISQLNEKQLPKQLDGLKAALALPTSPCTYDDLREFVKVLPDEDIYKELKDWLIQDEETNVKKSLTD